MEVGEGGAGDGSRSGGSRGEPNGYKKMCKGT